ncbi:Fic family protein, partial [Campylobacter coli]
LNALHPFREGNGRTQRIFLNELAKNAGYKLDLNLIPKDKMIMASVEASQLKLGKLEAIIKTNLKSFRQNLDLEQNKGISL